MGKAESDIHLKGTVEVFAYKWKLSFLSVLNWSSKHCVCNQLIFCDQSEHLADCSATLKHNTTAKNY